MPKFIVELKQSTTWEVEVEAEDEATAEWISRDWGRDDLNDDEIVNNCWDINVWEKIDE